MSDRPSPVGLRLDLKPVTQFSAAERAALKALAAAVYPPEVVATRPGRVLQWAPPEHGVLVWTTEGELGAGGELVSYVGIVLRAGTLDGAPVRIGGVGSVKTHPRAEGHGYASAGLRRAAAFLAEHNVDFSLLVCRDELLPFYGRRGWLAFDGRLMVEQPAGRTLFTLNRPMVAPGRRPAPREGVIDLLGLPW